MTSVASNELVERPEEVLQTSQGFNKVVWQREKRHRFKAEHGYSDRAHYGAGGLRKDVLERDGYTCVECGMNDAEHKAKWNRPITIDHKDRDRKNNTIDNLQTLCLTCHGRKDLSARLRTLKVPEHRDLILSWRQGGATYQQIADELGFSVASIWKWCKRWEKE